MRYINFPVSDNGGATKISELGFGCAPLMGRVGRGDSLKALHSAEQAGVNFFDTARSYGYGESEGLLGDFLRGRRASMVVCTKFGILPPKGGWKQKVKPLAQAAIRVFPGMRQFARRQASGESTGNQFSVAVLRESFETSLRELKTDYVDMLIFHAAPVSVLDQDDLLDALGRLVESGKVRMAGISGDHPVIRETFRRQPKAITLAQFALNRACFDFVAATQTPEAQRLLLIANHPYGGPAGAATWADTLASLRNAPGVTVQLRDKFDINDPQLMPELLLNAILRGTGISVVLPSMMRSASLSGNVRALDHCRFTDEELDLIRVELTRRRSAA
ncbi:aldo/keto reductase [Acidicapsa dinghuensis]|uniref:Aldo/keto reductase n=1 Tax=Acidicapsa dinghuensis TaxID=2218256 RepID=A0ABW1EAC5_9BACT|nr:aldo/keto reductase [Acidicapsa dinghuensis]